MDLEQRTAWVDRATDLVPGADVSSALDAFEKERTACLAELGAVPGHDTVRAVLLRLLPATDLAPEERSVVLSGVRDALVAFDGRSLDRLAALRRPPGWVLLAALEWSSQTTDDDARRILEGIEAGVAEALSRLAPSEACGPGEVLWAVAETAADAGWHDHAAALLARAEEASFDDEQNRGRVSLLRILDRIEGGDVSVQQALDALLQTADLDDRTVVHAHWLSALAAHEQGEDARAFLHLDAALERVDSDEDPEVVARLRDAHRAWSGQVDGPGEA